MQHPILEIKALSAKLGGLDNINWTLNAGEQWALIGKSGSGKTSLAHALIGQLFHSGQIIFHLPTQIELVEQQHRFRTLSNTTDFYYQQRFQSQDADDAPTILEELQPFIDINKVEVYEWLRFLHLDQLVDEPLIQLSNGENKRLQLCKSLLRKPSLLLLDMPFTGLDTDGRLLLRQIIGRIVSSGIHVLLICSEHEIPDSTTHIAEMEKGRMIFQGRKEQYQPAAKANNNFGPLHPQQLSLLPAPTLPFVYAVKMVNVTIQYGDRKILDNVNWIIKKGECWSLSGPNGAGKSTLLSLITADNPQAYANEIYLFDKRRGRGESIWDIKKHIGLVSPEMHLYFPFTSTCFEVIASGLFDTVGLFRALTDEQEMQTERWVDILHLKAVAHKTIQQLSMSEQRLALLARALIKNPPMLVLDEPCQGLDTGQILHFNALIDQLCQQFGTTLIYVSHYKEQLPHCVQQHLQLKEGKVTE